MLSSHFELYTRMVLVKRPINSKRESILPGQHTLSSQDQHFPHQFTMYTVTQLWGNLETVLIRCSWAGRMAQWVNAFAKVNDLRSRPQTHSRRKEGADRWPLPAQLWHESGHSHSYHTNMHTRDDNTHFSRQILWSGALSGDRVAPAGIMFAAHTPCTSISRVAVSGMNHLTD